MGKERGRSFIGGLEKQEARLIGPYPPWQIWSRHLQSWLEISFKDGDYPVDLFADFYRLRRLAQKARKIDIRAVEDFWERAEKECPGFEEKYEEITTLIIKKTPVKTDFGKT